MSVALSCNLPNLNSDELKLESVAVARAELAQISALNPLSSSSLSALKGGGETLRFYSQIIMSRRTQSAGALNLRTPSTGSPSLQETPHPKRPRDAHSIGAAQ